MHATTSNTPSLNIAFFSTRDYEKDAFAQLFSEARVALNPSFFEYSLNQDTAHLCEKFDVVVVFVNDKVDAQTVEILAKCGVKHIALRCAGFNNVDIVTAQQHDITVSRVPAYSPETVAEHTLALILTLNRKTHKAYNRVREGNFSLNGLLGFTLHQKTVGVIGTGRIGKAVIKILLGFGCNVICHDLIVDESVEAMGARYVSLDTLLKQSVIVTLHCPLNESSQHLINEDTLALMPDGVMLINTSRGGLVDDRAIIKGLKSKKIGYLGLDVYERESELFFEDHSTDIIQDDNFQRLTTFPNVLITGHQGFFTQEALNEIAHVTVSNIINLDNVVSL